MRDNSDKLLYGVDTFIGVRWIKSSGLFLDNGKTLRATRNGLLSLPRSVLVDGYGTTGIIIGPGWEPY
jgi:hypothetical protein